MTASRLNRGAAAAGAFGLAGASLIGGASAAAAGEPCPYPGSVEIVPDVCQVVITADGVHTFPAALGKVSAVLVGAGGGATHLDAGAYGGGGGEVVYVDAVSLDTPLTADIGAGGLAGDDVTAPTDGEDTTLGSSVARGGFAPTPYPDSDTAWLAGYSGNGNEPSAMAAGGAAGDAANWDDPGPGYSLSTIPGVDPALFPASANGSVSYGLGGLGIMDDATVATPPVVPNSGAGGNAFWNRSTEPESRDSVAGSDGVIIIRYEAAALASTGTDATAAIVFGAAAAALGGGLVAASSRMRRRPSTP